MSKVLISVVFSRSNLETAMNTVYSGPAKAARTPSGKLVNFRDDRGNEPPRLTDLGSPEFLSQTLGSRVQGSEASSPEPLGIPYGVCGDFPEPNSGHSPSVRPPVDPSFARAEKFHAQATAHRFLAGSDRPRGGRWRLSVCLRTIQSGAGCVAVFRGKKSGKAHYGQLMRCGSGWTCPMCSTQCSEFDRDEIARAMDTLHGRGGRALMVTLTHSHTRGDGLKEQLDLQRSALRYMSETYRYKELIKLVNRFGQIRATEITMGHANGWHPHIHDLWFLEKKISARKIKFIKAEIFDLWHAACLKVGLPLPSEARGVDVKEAFSPAEYFSKFGRETTWGSARELTKGHIKVGKEGRYTPFDLLRGVLPREQSRDLFREYATATFGRSRLRWTKGLREALGLPQSRTDAQKVEKQSRDADNAALHLLNIGTDDWKAVLRNHGRSRILDLAEREGAPAVAQYINSIRPEADAGDDWWQRALAATALQAVQDSAALEATHGGAALEAAHGGAALEAAHGGAALEATHGGATLEATHGGDPR